MEYLISFFIAYLLISGVVSTTFTVTNMCNYTIWPGFLSNEDDPAFSTTSFSLRKGQSKSISAPASWDRRFWGHTYCTEDSTGKFSCITGDCGSGKLECSGNGTAPSATLTAAEFKLGGSGCVVDLNGTYPSELKVNSSDGEIMVCKCVCTEFGSSPQSCASDDYQIIFCAAKGASPRRRSALGSTTVVSSNGTASGPNSSSESVATSPAGSTISIQKGTNTKSSATITSNITNATASSNSPEAKPPSPLPETRPNMTTPRTRLALIIAGVIVGALLIIFLILILIWRARWWRKSPKTQEDLELEGDHINQVPGMPMRFSYEDLCVATRNFSERLGRGGSGSVFKGILEDGTYIAVKKLENVSQDMSAFVAEVQAIGSLHHFNLVRLIGYCAEKSFGLLVFEYMNEGSLDKWIFKNGQRSCLDWLTRKKITLGIAKGLAYLHEDCLKKIIHFDIKPQNILLDQNFNPKICDFGLSELIDREMSQVQTPTRGTPGYIAPECCKSPPGRITVKADIYSFGIVLLEIVCARKNVDDSQLPDTQNHLLRMLQKKGQEDRLIDIVENLDDQYTNSDREETTRMIKIAAWCLQDDPERRPLMSTVVKVLDGVMEVDSNIVYKFAHALISPPVVNHHFSSAQQPASVLSYPR